MGREICLMLMDLGKLPTAALTRLVLDRISSSRPEVVVGARIGEDTCVIRTPDVCVVTTDPITAAEEHSGFLAMHINANDIAASGAEPFAALVTILLPPHAEERDLSRIIDEMSSVAVELGVDIIGGHTEVTDAVRHTVVSATMLGLPVVPGRVVSTGGMRPDDTLVMTKYAGIEGTMILAGQFAERLREHLDEQDNRQLRLLRDFISVVPEGLVAAQDPHVSAMHDITEGGVIGALQEMCASSGTGAALDLTKVPVLPVTRKICALLDVDVNRLISSGSMLIAVSEQSRLMEKLAEQGIPATVIGKVETGGGVYDRDTGHILPEQSSDALYHAGSSDRESI